jgi:acetylornithine deacetylase/succinyl-diaminopimelate desuccinylase-like protein
MPKMGYKAPAGHAGNQRAAQRLRRFREKLHVETEEFRREPPPPPVDFYQVAVDKLAAVGVEATRGEAKLLVLSFIFGHPLPAKTTFVVNALCDDLAARRSV